MTKKHDAIIEAAYKRLAHEYHLSPEQADRIKRYLDLLLEVNETHNLTAIRDDMDAVNFHLFDSLEIAKHYDFSSLKAMADVGSGGGLPGLPLAILYPELSVTLIEVKHKKIEFLWRVIHELDLKNVFVYELDWRTFLRKTDFDIQLFCARASLPLEELFRIFKPSCPYNNADLVYWASRHWVPSEEEKKYFKKSIEYEVGSKQRRLIYFNR